MSGMPDMTPTPFAAAIAPRTAKIIKNDLCVLKEEKICYKWYTTLCIYLRNRVSKLEFKQ